MFAQSLCPLLLAPSAPEHGRLYTMGGCRWAGNVAGVPTSPLPFFPEKKGWQVAPLESAGTIQSVSGPVLVSERQEGWRPGSTTTFLLTSLTQVSHSAPLATPCGI